MSHRLRSFWCMRLWWGGGGGGAISDNRCTFNSEPLFSICSNTGAKEAHPPPVCGVALLTGEWLLIPTPSSPLTAPLWDRWRGTALSEILLLCRTVLFCCEWDNVHTQTCQSCSYRFPNVHEHVAAYGMCCSSMFPSLEWALEMAGPFAPAPVSASPLKLANKMWLIQYHCSSNLNNAVKFKILQ